MAKLNVSNVKNAKCELRPLKLTDGGGLYLYMALSSQPTCVISAVSFV